RGPQLLHDVVAGVDAAAVEVAGLLLELLRALGVLEQGGLDVVGQEAAVLERRVDLDYLRLQRDGIALVLVDELVALVEGLLVERASHLAVRVPLRADQRDLDVELQDVLEVRAVLALLLEPVDLVLRQRDEPEVRRDLAQEVGMLPELRRLRLRAAERGE